MYGLDQHLETRSVGGGELYLRGLGCGRELLNARKKRLERFIPILQHKSARGCKDRDLVRLLPTQSDVLGRIVSSQKRGFRIELGEVEWALFNILMWGRRRRKP